jgi:signal transduction histidine kinase
MKPFFVETDCTVLLRPLVHEYRERAAEKSLTLEYEEQANMIVCTDESLLTQVVENLLSNAVKYSPPHTSIWLSLESLTTPNGQQNETMQNSAEQGDWAQGLRISVRDEGPGFQDAEKHKLFGKFARLSAQPTGGEDSTGLGLSIVKKMVEAMNGKVWCESEAGKGATFIVELPLVAAEERNSSIFIT